MVKNKTEQAPPFQTQLHSCPFYLLLLSSSGDWECGLQTATVCPSAPSSPHLSPPPVGPPHRLQFFKKCSRVGPCHGVQSFRTRLLWCGVACGLQCGYLLHCGHLRAVERRPASHGLLFCFPCMAAGESAPSPGAPPPPPSSLTLVFAGLFPSHFLTSLSQLLLCSVFYPFFNTLSQSNVAAGLGFGQQWVQLGASWN